MDGKVLDGAPAPGEIQKGSILWVEVYRYLLLIYLITLLTRRLGCNDPSVYADSSHTSQVGAHDSCKVVNPISTNYFRDIELNLFVRSSLLVSALSAATIA
jgi:hypothetical protein